MPKFRVVIEEETTTLKAKVFEAKDKDDAILLAEEENWDDPSWEDYAEGRSCVGVRDDLTEEIKE